MTNKEQRVWRTKVQQNVQNNYKPKDRLISLNPTDKRLLKRKKIMEPIEPMMEKPANPEHERQMHILDEAIAKSKPNKPKQIIDKPVINNSNDEINVLIAEGWAKQGNVYYPPVGKEYALGNKGYEPPKPGESEREKLARINRNAYRDFGDDY
jgi:hypothetical protein